MASSYDLKILNNDFVFQSGDFVIDVSDQQHVADTINAFPGWWKENPPDGVAVYQYLNSSGKEQEVARKIKLQLTADGYLVSNPDVINQNGLMLINPNAIKL